MLARPAPWAREVCVRRLSEYPFEPWFLEHLRSVQTFCLMTHVSPDADGLGAQLGFARAAQLAGKRAFIVNEDPCPPRYSWMDPGQLIADFDHAAGLLAQAELGMIFDAHEVDRAMRPARRMGELGKPLWVVDHHPADPALDLQGVISAKFSSSGELVYRLIRALGWPIDADVAAPLYAAMSFDTGSFRFLRNQSDTLRVAADLLDTGLDTNPIQEALFASRPRAEVELLGRALRELRFAGRGRIAWAVLGDEVTAGLDLAVDALGEMIPTFIGIDGVLVALIVKPGRKPGEWKLSFRSKTAVRIGSVARDIGGGGHEHAAGATLQGDPHAIAADIVSRLEAVLHQQLDAPGAAA